MCIKYIKAIKVMFDINSAFCSVELFTACQSSTDRKGGQAVPSLCNQCWGVCGGPTAIPDYSQNVRTSHCCGLIQVEEEQRCQKITVLKMNLSLVSVNLERLHSSSENKVSQRATGCVYMMTVRTEDADVASSNGDADVCVEFDRACTPGG